MSRRLLQQNNYDFPVGESGPPVDPPTAPSDLEIIFAEQSPTPYTLLHWTDGTEADQIDIYRRDNEAGDFNLINSVPWGDQGYTDEAVSEFGTYEYKLKAVNSGGESDFSNTTDPFLVQAPFGFDGDLHWSGAIEYFVPAGTEFDAHSHIVDDDSGVIIEQGAGPTIFGSVVPHSWAFGTYLNGNLDLIDSPNDVTLPNGLPLSRLAPDPIGGKGGDTQYFNGKVGGQPFAGVAGGGASLNDGTDADANQGGAGSAGSGLPATDGGIDGSENGNDGDDFVGTVSGVRFAACGSGAWMQKIRGAWVIFYTRGGAPNIQSSINLAGPPGYDGGHGGNCTNLSPSGSAVAGSSGGSSNGGDGGQLDLVAVSGSDPALSPDLSGGLQGNPGMFGSAIAGDEGFDGIAGDEGQPGQDGTYSFAIYP